MMVSDALRPARAGASSNNAVRLLSTLVLGVSAAAFAAAPASAAGVSCGDVIEHSIKLKSDLGPCPGDGHGLIVRADNITVDLGGHTLSGDNGPLERVGIRLGNVHGVTVRNGTVTGFDAGVDIEGGGGNTVERITAVDNVNDLQEPFAFTPGTPPPPQQMPFMLCDYGDGITTGDSDGNVIQHNKVVHNGPYAGISLVDDSDHNIVRDNHLENNNVANLTTSFSGASVSGLCGATLPGAPGMQRGRPMQAIGIRIEGSGADDNTILGNHVDNSGLAGISIHSYVCHPAPGEPRSDQEPNMRNLIQRNHVSRTGMDTHEIDEFADGIAVLASGPIGVVTCTSWDNTIVGNTSIGNLRNGISLGNTTHETTVSENVVTNNAEVGVKVYENTHDNTLEHNRGHANGTYDGSDDVADCGTNDWTFNLFGTVDQPCVSSKATGA